MEIFSLPLSNFSKYLRKESHYLLHVDYLHSEKEKKEKKLVYNSSINCPKSVLQVVLHSEADNVHRFSFQPSVYF